MAEKGWLQKKPRVNPSEEIVFRESAARQPRGCTYVHTHVRRQQTGGALPPGPSPPKTTFSKLNSGAPRYMEWESSAGAVTCPTTNA